MSDRVITIPRAVLQRLEDCQAPSLIYTVQVNWPELQLTEGQILGNALARAWGHPAPHPDRSIIDIRIERW